MSSSFILAALALAAAPASALPGDDGWNLEIYLGSAKNLTTPLKIHQPGLPDLEVDGDYATKPFEGTWYFGWRIGRWKEGRAWEFESIHHKLYLEPIPNALKDATGFAQFEISHGYNLLMVNRAWDSRGLVLRLGAGIVATHPELRVRGRIQSHVNSADFWPTYFHVSGPAVQLSASRRLPVWRWLFLSLEGKLTAAMAEVPLGDGWARVPNVALHGVVIAGLGPRPR